MLHDTLKQCIIAMNHETLQKRFTSYEQYNIPSYTLNEAYSIIMCTLLYIIMFTITIIIEMHVRMRHAA